MDNNVTAVPPYRAGLVSFFMGADENLFFFCLFLSFFHFTPFNGFTITKIPII